MILEISAEPSSFSPRSMEEEDKAGLSLCATSSPNPYCNPKKRSQRIAFHNPKNMDLHSSEQPTALDIDESLWAVLRVGSQHLFQYEREYQKASKSFHFALELPTSDIASCSQAVIFLSCPGLILKSSIGRLFSGYGL